ncbi:sensor histidine kinase [Aeromicrobium sp. CF3.5]|uniref:sensor histidine kinase n=1 Tax=Aeromicrobium sp. CF3.5 TaxID=3373078 RepID=UPI003EE4A24C
MPSLDDIVRSQTALDDDDVAWLRALVTDWQIIADLSFCDLVLWVPDAEAKGMWAAAQIRPTTGPTTLLDDLAGAFVPSSPAGLVERSLAGGETLSEETDDLLGGPVVRVEAVPVRRDGRSLAVVARRGAVGLMRTSSALEAAYHDAAATLVEMIGRGEFPVPGARSDLADSLRVGDGFVRTDHAGVVRYASPNALSGFRRLGLKGDLIGVRLGEVTTRLVDRRPTDRGPLGLFAGATPGETDLENASGSLMVRVIPLRSERGRDGSLILLRDVTELRLRERQLVSKEATIREIHHRVKNNLQTVAALLRLQSRRSDLPEAREALAEAERRVGSIALVHETLSRSLDDVVDFDEIADRLLRSVLDLSDGTGAAVSADRIGSFGALPGAVATPLAMVITELVQNAASHAFADESSRTGHVTVAVNRIRDRLRLRVSDDGVGLPVDFDGSGGLGLSIVRTLVDGELGGTLEFETSRQGGTTVAISLTV